MSPTAVSSLVGDLVAMAKAAEELPQVEASLEVANREIIGLRNTIDKRDADIIGLQATIDGLRNSLKLTEANRDDAELRFLELEERFDKVASAIAVVNTHMAVADAVAKPLGGEAPRQVEAEAKPIPDPATYTPAPADAPQGQSAADPTAQAWSTGNGNTVGSQSATNMESASPQSTIDTLHTSEPHVAAPSEGVSVPTDPSHANTGLASEPFPSATTIVETNVGSPSDPTKPYLGKHYHEVVTDPAYYVSPEAWIAGGGTELDYWR